MATCCVERTENIITSDFLERNTSGEKRTINAILCDLEDERDEILVIDLSPLTPLLEDLRGASTLKRLSEIDEVEQRFEEAFVALCRYSNFEQNFRKLNHIFKTDCKTELELDYFKIMLEGGLDVGTCEQQNEE